MMVEQRRQICAKSNKIKETEMKKKKDNNWNKTAKNGGVMLKLDEQNDVDVVVVVVVVWKLKNNK